MSQFLSDPFCGYKYKLLPNDAIILKNIGEDQERLRERLGGREDQMETHSPTRVRVHLGLQE